MPIEKCILVKDRGGKTMDRITKEKLGRYGLSIRANRKHQLHISNNAYRWTQKEFCKDICSQNALINMEKGLAGRFHDNYILLAEKLGFKITHNPEIDQQIPPLTKRLYHALEFYDLDEIKSITQQLSDCLTNVKDYLWYGDLYRVVKAVEKHYLNKENLSRDDRHFFIDMLEEFSDEWDDIIKLLVFYSAFLDFDSEEYRDLFYDLNIASSKADFNKLCTLLYYQAENYSSKLYALFQELEAEWMEKKNIMRLIDLYNQELIHKSYFDVYELRQIEEKIKKMIQEYSIPKQKLAEVYFSLGATYLKMREYPKAIEMMQKCIENDLKKKQHSFAYLAYAQHMLGQTIVIPHYTEEEQSQLPPIYDKIYSYYSKFGHISAEHSENFLMDEILPLFYPDDELIVEMFQEELTMLIEQTNHYKTLTIYIKKTKKV